jgi:hypothetical protein
MFHHLVHHTLLLLPHPSPGLVHQEVHPQDNPKNNKIQLSEHVKDNMNEHTLYQTKIRG